jgi:hypothetical protein
MARHLTLLGIGMALLIGPVMPALASIANSVQPATRSHAMLFTELTPAEVKQCQQEQTQLQAELAQCTTDACRQQVQAAIAAHNQRCQ